MQKEILIACSPTFWGFMLMLIARIDLYLFEKGSLSARQAIAHEALFFLLGLGSVVVVMGFSWRWLFAKNWLVVGLGLLGSLGFFFFLALAGKNGAAILNAT